MQKPVYVLLKRYFLKISIALVVLPLAAWITQADNLDLDNGFGSYKFGSSPQEHKNLSLEIDEGTTKLYTTYQNAFIINGVEFSYIRITFCKNKLSVISLETKRLTGTKFLDFLKQNYGPPKPVKKDLEWLSKNVHLVYEPLSDKDGVVSFYSRHVCDSKK